MISINKICNHCGIEKSLDTFVKSVNTKSGYRGICKTCSNSYYANRRITHYDKIREYEKKFHKERRLRYQYNTTKEFIEDLKESQDNKCAICFSEVKLVIDHCHTSMKIRGMLCSKCNVGLGQFKDDTIRLENAIKYLNKAKE